MFKSKFEELAHIASLTDLEVCIEYNTNSREEAVEITNEYWDYYEEEDEEDFDDDTFFREKEQEYRFNNQRRYAI